MQGALANAKAIYFDVDDTLYDFAASMQIAFAEVRAEHPGLLQRHDVARIAEAYWSFYRGYGEPEKVSLINRDPDLFRRTMWAGALANLRLDEDGAARAWLAANHPGLSVPFADPAGFARIVADRVQQRRPAHWRVAAYPGARELLADLKKTRLLGAITNGPSAVQRPKLEAMGEREFFAPERVFVSGEFGARKPAPEIFLAAAKAAKVEPHECIMIGDAREFDLPAKAVGFHTVLFCGARGVPDLADEPWPPDAVVSSYRELRTLLL